MESSAGTGHKIFRNPIALESWAAYGRVDNLSLSLLSRIQDYLFFLYPGLFILYIIFILFIYNLLSKRIGSWTCVQSLTLLQLFLQLYNVKINTHHMGTQGRLIH